MVIQWSVAQDLSELLKSTRLDEVKYVLTEWSKDPQWYVPSQLEVSPCEENNEENRRLAEEIDVGLLLPQNMR